MLAGQRTARDHAREVFRREDVGEHRAHRAYLQGTPRQGPAEAKVRALPDPHRIHLRDGPPKPLGDLGAGAHQPDRNPYADGFPDHEEIGVESVAARIAAGARRNRMSLVDDQEGPRLARQRPKRSQETGERLYHYKIGHAGLGEHAGDLQPVGEPGLDVL